VMLALRKSMFAMPALALHDPHAVGV